MGYSNHISQWEHPRKFLCLQENLKPSPTTHPPPLRYPHAYAWGLANNKKDKKGIGL